MMRSSMSYQDDARMCRKQFLASAAAIGVGTILIGTPSISQAADNVNVGGKIRFGEENIMCPKEHGTSAKPVQSDLMYDVNNKLADRVRP